MPRRAQGSSATKTGRRFFPKLIGTRLRQLREARGYSLDALGAAVGGRSASALSLTETGQSNTPLDDVARICEELGARLYVAILEKDSDEELGARLTAALPWMTPAHLLIVKTSIASAEAARDLELNPPG